MCILYICVFFCVLVLPRACETRAGLVCLLCVKCVCVCAGQMVTGGLKGS